MRESLLSYLSLFGSIGTLLCCALPIALVTLGFGATLAAIVGSFPQLIWLSENKGWLFLIASLLVASSFLWSSKTEVCPDEAAEGCRIAKSPLRWLRMLALIFLLTGFITAYLLPVILQ